MPKLGICSYQGKTCFDKRGAISAKNKRWHEDHVKLRVYECPHCGRWHLTKQIYDENVED